MSAKIKRRMREGSINLFYLPALALFVVFVVYPLVSGVQISLTNWNGYSANLSYVGFANYKRLFGDKMFYTALRNTLVYGFGCTAMQSVLGVLYGLLLQKKFRGQSFARVVIYLPAMIAPLIMGYICYFLTQYHNGALNDIVMLFGGEPKDWMDNGTRAVVLISIVNTLQFVGKTMIIIIAGLQNIPQSYEEAAEIDGASYMQRVRHITLPLLMPAITTTVVLNLIGGLKLFGIILSMSGGGPGYSSHSLSTLIHYLYFQNQNAGYAAAVGLVMFFIIALLTTLVRRILEGKTGDLH